MNNKEIKIDEVAVEQNKTELEDELIKQNKNIKKDYSNIDKAMTLLIDECKNQDLELSEHQRIQFEKFYEMVLEKNKVMNLTTILERNDFFNKHLIDSILPQKFIKMNSNVLDIGCGGGFPSIPLKIVRPDLNICAIDSTNKKIEFVKSVIKNLELENITAITARAEEMGQGKARETFDVVVSRAVAPLPMLMELSLPLVKVGGYFIAFKTDENDANNIEKALYSLGAVLDRSIVTALPNLDKRCLLIFKKVEKTKISFPRNFGQMKKKPL